MSSSQRSPQKPAPAAVAQELSAQNSDDSPVEEANRNALIVVRDMREAAHAADGVRDPGTVDLFSKLVQIHEKHEWFLRDMLRTEDGLST